MQITVNQASVGVLAKKLPFGMMRPAQRYGACNTAGGGTQTPG